MHAPEILDHKADLMVRLEDPALRRAWRYQVSEDIRRPLSSIQEAIPDRLADSQAAGIIESLRLQLPEAEAFHVNREMSTLVQYAASQLDSLDRIDRTVLPTRAGIARFEGGLPFIDVRGRKMLISWAVWAPVMVQYARPRGDTGEPFEATVLYLFNDHFDEPDEIYHLLGKDAEEGGFGPEHVADVKKLLGRWGFIGANNLYDGMRLGPAQMTTDAGHAARILAEGDTPHAYTNPLRLLHAFWLLLGQTVTDTSDVHLTGRRRKKAMQAGIPARVTVIQLRRIESKRSEGETFVEWSHRWVVRGHWAWYHCGPDHPYAQEVEPGKFMCRLWRAPFVKGPQDKPLIVTEKVYALHR
jgi:hypothetical protein